MRSLTLALILSSIPFATCAQAAAPAFGRDCGARLDGHGDCRPASTDAVPALRPALLAAVAGATTLQTSDQAEAAATPESAAGGRPGPEETVERPPPSLATPLPPGLDSLESAAPGRPSQAPGPATPEAPVAAQPTPMPAAGPAEVPEPPVLPLPAEPPSTLELPVMPPLVNPGQQDFSGPSPWVLPPRDPAAPGAASPAADAALGPLPKPGYRGDDARLYEGLPWDYCGPRVGLTGIGGAAAPSTDARMPVDVDADQALYDRRLDVITLRGGVEFVQGEQRLTADRSAYERRTGAVEAVGDVYVEYPGARLTADSGRYNLNTKQGTLEGVSYRLAGNANLRGTAEQADLLADDKTRYRDVIYTTCPPGRSDWSLRASELMLDHEDGMGTAYNARIRLAGVPVLYSPYLRFPIDDRRRSGLLIPTIGSSNVTGTDITIPYYWNIAPQMDATFYPRYMSSRGLMMGGEFRHLSTFQTLNLGGELLPNDSKDEEGGTRWALRLEQAGRAGRWTSRVDYNAVSDDRYLPDFGNRLDVTSVRNLPQRGDIGYQGRGYRVLGWVQDFQTVDPTIPARATPYAQLPHVEFHLQPPRGDGLLDYGFEGRYDYFSNDSRVQGNRVVALPSVRLPMRRSYGYLVPRGRVFYTGYDLSDTAPDVSARQSHLIPSLDVDGKLIFERELDWFGNSALQTLEPRLYYVLTPYKNQTDTPLFDTTELDFSFASLFRPNRFTGYDRIGDENRLTVGLTSRTLGSSDGRELFRASLGQVYYFQGRQVQLSGDALEEDSSSSVAGELAASLSEDWSARASLQWNPHQTQDPWEKQVLQLRYAPGKNRILNLAYRYNLGRIEAERYEDTDLSFRLPVTAQVQLVGRWLYSLLNEETVDAFAGIEFGRCCWRLRVLGRHLKTSASDNGSTSIMLQLELAGLGALGNSIDKLLEQGIYGYRPD